MSTIRELLNQTSIDRVDAKVLLTHLCKTKLGWPKSALISRDTEALPESFIQQWQDFEKRRANGEPVAYIIGHREFHEIDLFVAPGALIPRPETELLVDLCIEHLKSVSQGQFPLKLLDLGTGSGAIALAIAHHFKSKGSINVKVTGLDISEEALSIAQQNCSNLDLNETVTFLQSSWFEAIPTESFDVIVSNPPYIPANDSHLSQGDLRFEPSQALTDNANGLSAYQLIIENASNYLVPGGLLAFEHGYDQASAIKSLFEEHGFKDVKNIKDYAGLDRITYGFAS